MHQFMTKTMDVQRNDCSDRKLVHGVLVGCSYHSRRKPNDRQTTQFSLLQHNMWRTSYWQTGLR